MSKFVPGLIGGFLLGLTVSCTVLDTSLSAMLLPFALAAGGGWWGARLDAERLAERTAQIRQLEDREAASLKDAHNLDEIFLDQESGHFIGIAWDQRRVVAKGSENELVAVDFSKLTDVELELQKERWSETDTEIKTNRTSQVIGATVGAASFGVAGAVVGGLSGTQTSSSVTTEDSYIVGAILRIRMLSRSNPLVEITFYKQRKRDHHVSPDLRVKLAERFHAHLSNILFEERNLRA